MKKQITIACVFSVAVVCLLAFVKYLQISAAIAEGANRVMPPSGVTTITVTERTWPRMLHAVGSLTAVQGATLSTEEFGRVAKIHVDSGSEVEAGQLLIELDSSVEKAQLAGARAQLELAQINAKRQQALRERNANAQSDLESAEASLRNAIAEVERLEAVIERKKIIAPFPGKLGIRQINVGQTLNAGTPVISLQASHELFIDFSLPQSALSELVLGAEVRVEVDAYPGTVFTGALSAIEPQVETATRNVMLQARIDNSEKKLLPGMFANVTVVAPKVDTVLAIPISSVNYNPYGNSVFVIERDASGTTTVKPQTITTGSKRGDLVVVQSGLSVGQEVVTSGGFKLRPGSEVVVTTEVAPGAELAPTPTDT